MPMGLKTEKRELPDECEIDMVKGCCNLPFGLFAFFMLYSGLRRGELLALKWEDIDFKKQSDKRESRHVLGGKSAHHQRDKNGSRAEDCPTLATSR